MRRLFLLLGLVFMFTATLPVSVSASEPEWPSNPACHHIVFDSNGPDSNVGVWIWNERRFSETNDAPSFWDPRWEWNSLEVQVLQSSVVAGEPLWSTTPATITVVAGSNADSGERGYWVWNPYRFVGDGSGHTVWSPGWVWAADGTRAELTD